MMSRGSGLIDQDRVDLVDDGVEERPLDHLGQIIDHVVAQVIEAELVVGAIGNVGAISLGSRDRTQVNETLIADVLASVFGVVDKGLFVDDHPRK